MATTPRLGLYIPADGERNWGAPGSNKVSYNFTLIDGAIVEMEALIEAHSTLGKHDHLAEKTAGHGIVLDSKLDTSITDLEAAGSNLIRLIMVLGA